MPVGIVEVINNTGSLLHYNNEESGYSFDVQPTSYDYGTRGYMSASPFKDDTVPFKSSGKKINVSVDGGPHFSMWDDGYHFYIFAASKPDQWTASFDNGSQFVMKVDSGAVTFVKYQDSLKTNSDGYVATGNTNVVSTLSGPEYKIEL